MRRGVQVATRGLKALFLACTFCLAIVAPGAAGDFFAARPMVNPNYLVPEIPAHLWPACQVQVKIPAVPQYGVTSDDLLYCELPRYASRFPSDPCACTFKIGGVKLLRSGMVVWRPSSWGYVIGYPH